MATIVLERLKELCNGLLRLHFGNHMFGNQHHSIQWNSLLSTADMQDSRVKESKHNLGPIFIKYVIYFSLDRSKQTFISMRQSSKKAKEDMRVKE